MIALPLAGIIGLLIYNQFSGGGTAEKRVDDRQSGMEILIAEVDELEREAHEVMGLIRNEAPDARERSEALRERLEHWMDEYDRVTQNLRDEDGRLRDEYAGYDVHRKRINTVRVDLLKTSGFF